MRELISAVFNGGKAPADWHFTSENHTFERGALRSGKYTVVQIPLPGLGWKQLRIETEIEPLQEHCIVHCWNGDFAIEAVTIAAGPYPRHTIKKGPLSLGESVCPVPPGRSARRIAFELEGAVTRIFCNDELLLSVQDPYPCVPGRNMIQMEFWDDCLVHRVRVLGDQPRTEPLFCLPLRQNREFFLEVAVDFFDDLIPAPYTLATFDRLFDEFKRWGVKRCHWFHYGEREDGWWDMCSHGVPQHAAQTFANVGRFLPTAVQAAHRHGIEIYGVFKPFDVGLHYGYAITPGGERQGRLPYIGGPIAAISKFLAEHRELVVARRPGNYGDAENPVFTRIDLVKEDDKPCAFSVGEIELYVSDDNAKYHLYDGTVTRQEMIDDYPVYRQTPSGPRSTAAVRRARVMRLTGLQLRHKYIALKTPGKANSFVNSLANLVHVFGDRGEETKLTYGNRVSWHTRFPAGQSQDFKQVGVEFDVYSHVGRGGDVLDRSFIFDAGKFLALARGKERGPVAVLSPSFPQTRQWWLDQVKTILESGADGVELRVICHQWEFAWDEYGFEAPVVEAFKQRYGVDILASDDFDRAALRRLRGEAYTEFYREAKRLVQSYGKRLGLHVGSWVGWEPEQFAPLGIHFDWRTWLQEGLADSVTFKDLWPGTHLADEVLSYGIPVIFTPANFCFRSEDVGTVEQQIQAAQAGGCDGFQFYENAAVVKATPEGDVVMEQPALRKLFQKYFGSPTKAS